MQRNIVSLIVIVVLAIISIYIVLPIQHMSWLEGLVSGDTTRPRDLTNLKLGLDLRGGTQVLLEADLPEGQTVDAGAMSAAKTIVDNRVNGLGVAEAVVQQQGENRIIVELPGVDNPEQAVETIRSTGQLEFVEPDGITLRSNMVINTTNHPTAATDLQAQIAEGKATDPTLTPFEPDKVFTTVMTGGILRNANVGRDRLGRPQIEFVLTSEGSSQFFDYTSTHVNRQLPIVLDGRVLSAPNINSAIRDNGVIEGSFSQEEADSLAVQMRYGALPVPLKVIDVRTIGASLGQNSVDRSLRAGIIGFIAVLAFMVIIYRLPGVLASVALVLYIVFNLTIYKLIPVTLTLPGIAGFLLSIGMAVDANVLIFERMKEELRVGRSLRLAVEAGFSRAWPAIRDGNVSTLITCAVLYWFGSSFGASIVKGFAVTLVIGVVLSMLTAVLITRTFMRSFLAGSRGSTGVSRSMIGY
ncbi:MAG: protein translocase subunit SecD [Caldilineaceae bacterium]